MYMRVVSVKKSKIFAAILFLHIFSYLKYTFLGNIKLHYFLPILLILISLFFNKIKLQKELTIFVVLTLMSSFFSYVIFDILSYDDFGHVIFNNILFVANILLTFIVVSTLEINMVLNILFLNSLIYSVYLFIDILRSFASFQIFRYTGTFEDPNYFVIVNLLFIAVNLYFLKENKNKFITIAALLSILINITSIFLTFSRSGYLAFFVFTLSFLYFNFSFKLLAKSVLLLFSFASTLIFAIIFLPEFSENLLKFLEWRFLSDSEVESGLSRFKEIGAGINFLVANFPLSLLGMGYASSEVHSFFKNFYSSDSLIEPRIHNTYAAVFIENGIMAFAVFALLLFKIYRLIIANKLYRKYFLPLYFSTLTSSLFIWNLYFLPFYISVFWIPFLIKKSCLNRS